MLYLAIISLILALSLFFIAFRQRRIAGLPAGKVIYVDASQWQKVEKPLYDRDLRLTGKPDYLVKKGNQVIPVEVKTGHAPREPYPWHIAQLVAYCALVERIYGTRPAHGILHYADRTLEIGYTRVLEQSTITLIKEMQKRASQIQIDRSHRDPPRCIHCGYRSRCDQALRI